MTLLLHRLAIRALALAVPRTLRTEWIAEWQSELWYMAGSATQREIAAFCWGAIEDARSLRAMHPVKPVRSSGSARACVGSIGAIAIACFGLAQQFPSVRLAATSPVYRSASDSVAISPQSPSNGPKASPTVTLEMVRHWQNRRQHLFSEFAFYTPMTRAIHLETGTTRPLALARASANMLSVLGVPISFAQQPRGGDPVLMLSQTAWRRDFASDLGVLGQTVKAGTLRVRIGGIVPDQAAPAGKLDGWILLPETGSLPESTAVYLIGKLAPGSGIRFEQWEMHVPGDSDFTCRLLPALRADIWTMYLFAAFLAILALPATTSLSLGEYAARPVNLSWVATLRRWLFLMAKIAFALPAIYFASLTAAYALRFASPYTSQYVQLIATFSLTLFALRWAIRDQRQRCPVCLGKLTCPARVGEPSRNFLAFNGTELICADGHGFLHVPEMATSWFGTQRWLHLDPSWSGLFLNPAKAMDF